MNAAPSSPLSPMTEPDALQTRYARKITAALDAASVPHDIEQRLRVARELAVSRARAARSFADQRRRAQGVAMVGGGQAALKGGSDGAPWWAGTSMFALLALLVIGLLTIEYRSEQAEIEAAAEIDAALLADDLPPAAYSDAGFREFLRLPLSPAPAPAEAEEE
jgi:hypothetical protein